MIICHSNKNEHEGYENTELRILDKLDIDTKFRLLFLNYSTTISIYLNKFS